MNKRFLIIATILGALSVAFGAFAAHGLKKILSEYSVSIFETGVRYQFYHVFALLVAAILYQQFKNKYVKWSGNLFIIGTALFSGSLYILAFKELLKLDWLKFIGPITPLGGVCFIAGWIFLLLGIITSKSNN